MKSRIVVIAILLLAMAAGWYFIFEKNSSKGRIEELIPATSIGVLSVSNATDFYEELATYDWWDELAEIPFLASGKSLLSRLDTLAIKSDLSSLPIFISFHITANNQIDPLYFIESKGFEWNAEAITTILNRVYGEGSVSITERLYQDKTIHEVQLPEDSFSFFIEGNYLAISPAALLVEDVIRATGQDLVLLAGMDYKLTDSRSDVSLLIDCSKMGDLASVFSTETPAFETADGLFLKMDIEASDQGLLFNGRSIVNTNSLREQETSLTLKNFVPTSASSMQWFGLNKTPENELTDFDLGRFLDQHGGELCRVKMDLNNQNEDLVLLVSLDEPDLANAMLNQFATTVMADNDTLFRESFMETDIIFINKAELPQILYGDRFEGFEQTYYTIFNNVLMFGNNVEVLKTMLSEYDAENTWGRSIERRRYIDNLVQETNFTSVYNFEFLLEGLNDKMKANWQDFFDQRGRLTAALDVFSFQLSTTGAGVLINASLDFNESAGFKSTDLVAGGTEPGAKPDVRVNAFADTTLITAPFVVTNHNDGSREVVLQDLDNQLYLIDDQGVVQWKKDVNRPINGVVSQIDYYNNRKLQYFFFTDSAIHLVDRNGDDVEGFPKQFDTELPLGNHRVIDYDNTKRYRYTAADRRGNVYLYDKEGKLLEGWNPKAIGSQLLDVPEHVRIRGRDCFVMVEATGKVHLTNRRGEYYPGFPYNTGKRLAGDVRITKSSDFTRSEVVVTSDNGEVIRVNFLGAVQGRNQLLRPDVRSRFQLLRDKLNTGYAVLRRDVSNAVLINEEGKELFSVPLTRGANADFDFYNFRNDSEVFVVRNIDQREGSIFNKEGKLITTMPLAADAAVGIIYHQSRGEYELFVNFANQMTIYTVRK
ncbi:MAG: hypothetical protein HEP71_25075 [Roseivirga sp.]|nr:hypothetical protein [Roseivirga sp.]